MNRITESTIEKFAIVERLQEQAASGKATKKYLGGENG